MKEEIGSVEMVVGHEGGKVFLRFKEPMQVVLFDPPNCIDVACAMSDAAFEARDGLKPAGSTLKAELIERHRMTLTQRVALILNSQRENKLKSNGKLAQEVVEVCLKEIFS